MKKLTDYMAEELSAAFEKAGYDSSYGKVGVSNRPDLCEYQCNGAMAGAKAYKKAPFMIADDVVGNLADSKVFSMKEMVKPGFINLKVSEEFLADYLKEMEKDEKLGADTAKEPKTIVIDYGGPNVAKPLHVGHLRSAIIGESIKRIGRFVGHKVIGDVHLGDWGLQMGLIITELKHRQPELVYLEFVETIAETESNYAETLAESFEYLYNKLTCVKTFNPQACSANKNDLDVYKILLWELFICVIAYLRHIKDYEAINILLTYTYFLENSLFGGEIKQTNYTTFRHHSFVIEEHYKPMSQMKDKYTLVGNIICSQREKFPIYTAEAIAEADLFLYQVCNAYDLPKNERIWYGTCWFPTCYIYVENKGLEWERMKSRRYCKKMEVLFGVNDIEELKGKIEKCVYNSEISYLRGCDAAPAILNYIKVEDIGTLN